MQVTKTSSQGKFSMSRVAQQCEAFKQGNQLKG